MEDCKHEVIKCMKCHRYLPKQPATSVTVGPVESEIKEAIFQEMSATIKTIVKAHFDALWDELEVTYETDRS